MAQKQQKQSGKSPNKNPNQKQAKKTDKKPPNGKPTPEQLQELQTQKVKDFFSNSLLKVNPKIDITTVDQCIVANIMRGQIKIPEEPKNLSEFLKSPEEQAAMKITPEQMEIYEKEARRIEHLKLLANLNKQLTNKQPEQNIPYILTKDEHERKMREFIQEKRARQKKMQEIKKAEKQRIEKEDKLAEEKGKQLKLQEKQKRRIEIEQKITKQKEQHIHFLSQDIKHRKDLEQIQTKVPLHIKMEEKFKVSVELPELQQKKREYKQLREFKQRYSLDQIKNHEKQFLRKSRQKLIQSKTNRYGSLSTIQELSPKAPEKPQRLKSILAQEIHQMKKKWSEKEIYCDEKLRREENYLKKLKEEYKPKIDKEKQEEIKKRLLKQKEHLSRIGLEIDKRKVGLEYLGEVKKQAKKRIEKFNNTKNSDEVTLRHQYRSETLLPSMKRSYTVDNPLDRNRTTDFILKTREQRLSKIINSEEEPEQKLKMLEIETQKIEEVKRQKLGFLKHNFDEIASKQASNMALNSIKAKMNLIELMKRH